MVLAGGQGRRIGGQKALVQLAGRPLLHWPLLALMEVLDRVAVAIKPGSELPPLPADVEVWLEQTELSHPVVGIVEALRRAEGRPVLVCAVDLPLVDAATVDALARTPAGDSVAVVARGPGGLQPLLARYQPTALSRLSEADPHARLLDVVRALAPRELRVPDQVLLNVNAPVDLARAERALAARVTESGGQPNVKA